MTKRPSILAVVLNYQTAELCARAVRAALCAIRDLRAEIVVVDNASGDGSFEQLREDFASEPFVRVVQAGRNGGFGAGNNFGFAQLMTDGSEPDFLYILNSDAFPAQHAIRALADYLTQHPNVGIVGSYIHGPDNIPHITAFRFPSVLGELEGAIKLGLVSNFLAKHIVPLPVPRETVLVDWLAGASMMIRTSVFKDIGGFDERYFLYFEETDLCLQAARAGWPTVYVRESEVEHIGSVSTGMKEWERVPRYWFESRWLYLTKNHSVSYAILATALNVGGTMLHRIKSLLRGRKPGLAGRFEWDLLRHSIRSAFQRNHQTPAQLPSKGDLL